MYNLKTITPVIRHLQKISPGMFRDTGGELMIFCPYCDDSKRKNASNHGHMYLAVNMPVFNCFRCDTSGTIIRFLIDTGFTDEEVLKYIASFVKYKFVKNYSKTSIVNNQIITQLYKQNVDRVNKFKNEKTDQFLRFKQYLTKRIGGVDYNIFFIFPYFLDSKGQKYLSCGFNNSDNEIIGYRLIDSHPYFRYKKNPNQYHFQSRDFDKYQEITIGEGPFDIITLYLYNKLFKDSYFLCLNGKNYVSTIEKLVMKYILIGNYRINLIFDRELKNPSLTLRKCQYIAEQYNEEIEIKAYLPIPPFQDTGQFPQVMEL